MPLDPSVITGGKPVEIQTPSPLELITGAAKLQDVQAQVEQRRQAADKARQQAADQADVQRAMAAAGGDVETALPQLYATNPRAAAGFEETVGKARKETIDAANKNLDNQNKQLDNHLKVWGLVKDQPSLDAIRPLFVKSFPQLDAALPTEYGDGTAVQAVNDAALSQKDKVEQKQKNLELFAQGKFHESLGNALSQPDITPAKWDQTIQGAITMGMPKAVADEFGGVGGFSPANVANAARLAIPAATRVTEAGQAATRAETVARDAQTAAHQGVEEKISQGQLAVAQARLAVARQRIAQGNGTDADAKDIAAAIIAGDQPPTLQGLYRFAAPVRAELSRQGYPLTTATLDWQAAQQHFKTLNGAQQTRLRQAADTAAHSLDTIDTLAGQWHGGQFPVLNRANLALAKNGAYGADVATTARQLDAQIADVTSELANVYMGGNSPTDEALHLAAKNLSSDWSEKTLKDMTTLARTNLKIRQNAVKNVGAVGASDTNPYVPTVPTTPTPPPATGANPFRK